MQQRVIWTAAFDNIEVPAYIRQSNSLEWTTRAAIEASLNELDGLGYVAQRFTDEAQFGTEDYIQLERKIEGEGEPKFEVALALLKTLLPK